MSQPTFQTPNRLLTAMSPDDLALLTPHLCQVALDVRTSIEHANKPIPWIYFMERGITSVVACSNYGRERCIEAGLVGREGVTGAMVVLGDDRSPNQSYVQVAGGAQRIGSDELRGAMDASASLAKLLLRYVQTFTIQLAHTALANGTAKIEERLARWILMAQDRMGDDELLLTHEFMPTMLGVRRPGVTDTLHALEGRGLIRSTRGLVRVIDREGLVETANGSYGVPEAEYARLLG